MLTSPQSKKVVVMAVAVEVARDVVGVCELFNFHSTPL